MYSNGVTTEYSGHVLHLFTPSISSLLPFVPRLSLGFYSLSAGQVVRGSPSLSLSCCVSEENSCRVQEETLLFFPIRLFRL